jgi:hypothetical protein
MDAPYILATFNFQPKTKRITTLEEIEVIGQSLTPNLNCMFIGLV